DGALVSTGYADVQVAGTVFAGTVSHGPVTDLEPITLPTDRHALVGDHPAGRAAAAAGVARGAERVDQPHLGGYPYERGVGAVGERGAGGSVIRRA
ncbi:MAG: hypothetical protein M3Y35_01550, partial [Actinomycetota bacterium]|nr:hypothetical protein [Actinomycetota bacterium]